MSKVSFVRMMSAVLGITGVLLTHASFAGSAATSSVVTKVELNKGYGTSGLIFIKVDPAPTGKPCSNPDWDYVLAFNTAFDDKLYAQLLVAFSTGVQVWATGTGTCGDFSTVESLRSLQIMK